MPTIFSISSNSFKGQLPGEKTILVARRHWLFLFLPLFIIAVFSLVPVLIYFFIAAKSWYHVFSSLYWFLVSAYYLALWCLFFYNIMIYALNIFVLTNKRVIKKEQRGLFRHKEAELNLTHIEDVSTKVIGPIAELFRYGDLQIQTAATQGKFFFDRLPSPEKIKQAILQATNP